MKSLKVLCTFLLAFICSIGLAQSNAVNNQNGSVVCSGQGTGCQLSTDSRGYLITTASAASSASITRGAPVHTQPSVTTATSFTCLAANANRNYFLIQNNTAASILINLAGGTLTGIAPSATNLGIVLTAGSTYESPPNYVSTSAITCYQASGSTVNTISVTEG